MPEAADPAVRIAEALAAIRGARPFGPPGWQGPPWHQGGRGFGPHGEGRHGPPWHGHRGGRGGRGPFGRSDARMRLVLLLARAGEALSVSELAERLCVDQPRASKLVQAAVEAGQVRREADPRDARRTLIALTKEGRAAAAALHDDRHRVIEQALEGFTAAERRQLAELLTRFAEAWPR